MKANLTWPRYNRQMSADHWCHGDNGGSLWSVLFTCQAAVLNLMFLEYQRILNHSVVCIKNHGHEL